MYRKFIFFALAVFFLFLPRHAFADSNFSTSSQVTYTINSDGITHVQFSSALTNNTNKYYASSYKIHLGFNDIDNVRASDAGGNTAPVVTPTTNGEDLSMTFNNPVFGKGNSLPFSFSFDTKEVASLNGSIWEVNIPGLSNANDFSTFTVHIVAPSYFGNPTYIKPDMHPNSLTFTKDELGKSGISLAFGNKQIYSFNLTYNIKNTQLLPVQTEIALPPDTSYQKIEIDSISPRPQNVTMDSDDNWLAQYALQPSQALKITAVGKAYLSLAPTASPLTQSQYVLYTKPQQYWEANNPQIVALAQKLQSPKAIYDYVVATLQYDFARVSDNQDRLGAANVLNHPSQAVCLEFTDLFIALARAAGIPAREIDGYGYTQNTSQRPLSLTKEVLHAWPEYYDKSLGEWIMVDPTWENTTGGVDYFHTFDFDHLAFVVKGISSNYPVPAGGYKLPGQEEEKDVHVSFAPGSSMPSSLGSFAISSTSDATAGLPISASVILRNDGHVFFPPESLLAYSTFSSPQTIPTNGIPPFGSQIIFLNLGKTSFLTNATDTVTIRFAGKTIEKSLFITAFSLPVRIILGGVCIAILSIIISFITRRARRISISQ